MREGWKAAELFGALQLKMPEKFCITKAAAEEEEAEFLTDGRTEARLVGNCSKNGILCA